MFESSLDEAGLTAEERRIALELHTRGFAVIDFPDAEIEQRIARIKEHLGAQFGIDFADGSATKNTGENQRIQDAWLIDADVRAIASNESMLSLLKKLYGRRAIPFQTLNFPVGTQQNLHSDSNHFSSLPERFMCGVWLAFEDVHADAGPLTYLPGSHKWPIVSNIMIGRKAHGAQPVSAQSPFEAAWEALVAASNEEQEVFLARKGQALIWAANLLHGGSLQRDPTRTRWSQVTHYYFEDCIYYTPAFSDEALGRLDMRSITNISTGETEPNMYLGEEISIERPKSRPDPWAWRTRRARRAAIAAALPADFDAESYLQLNPDVAAAGADAAEHYADHGAREGRRYRRG